MDTDENPKLMRKTMMKRLFFAGVLGGLWAATILGSVPEAEKPLAGKYRSGNIKFTPVLIIDERNLPKDVYFQLPNDIKCDPQGNVYVSDMKAHQIFKFDPTGKFLKAIGRNGQGPGDFNMPQRMAVTSERIFVYDFMNERLCSFTLDGKFITSVSLAMDEGRPDKMKSLPNGDIVIGWEKTNFRTPETPQEYSIRIFSRDLTQIKTIYKEDVWRNKFVRINGRGTNIPQPFSPTVSWDVSPSGRIVIGFQKAYEIEIHDPDKGRITAFNHAYDPVKITPQDKETYFSKMTGGTVGGAVKKGAPDYVVKATMFPDKKPPFFHLFVDREGNILVCPYRKSLEEDGTILDAFTPDGTFIAQAKIDGNDKIIPAVFTGDGGFWTIRYDTNDIASLVKYRISD